LRSIKFTTSESSIRELDLSPDGKQLIFDLLGDIYTVPVEGGKATILTKGDAWDVRPVWSPDGKQVAFISDRNGSDQAFVVDYDPKSVPIAVGPRNTSKSSGYREREGFTQAVEWMPDGQSLIVDGDQVLLSGSAEEKAAIDARKNTSQYYGNGAAIYEFRQIEGSDFLRPEFEVWSLKKGSKSWKRNDSIVSGGPSSMAISKNGKWLVYRASSGQLPGLQDHDSLGTADTASHEESNPYFETIRVRDLTSQRKADRMLFGDGVPVPKDVAHRAAYSPNSRFLFTAYDGAIHRIELSTGKTEVVPTEIDVDQCLKSMLQYPVPVVDDPLIVKNMRSITLRPDGKQLVFSALRRLYVMDVPGNEPHLLYAEGTGQFQPAYSPDGKWVAFASWSETDGGHIWRVPASGGVPEQLTSVAGYYETPVWSPDGKSIALVGSSNLSEVRPGYSATAYEGSLILISVEDRLVRRLPVPARLGNPPTFSSDGTRIRYAPYKGGGSRRQFHVYSVSPDGNDIRDEGLGKILPSGPTVQAIPSPDGRLVAVIKYGNLYLISCSGALGTKEFSVSGCSERQITRDGAYDVRWKENGARIEWGFANTYYSSSTKDLISEAVQQANRQAEAPSKKIVTQSIDVNLRVPRAIAHQSVVLRGAQIVTMRGNEVLENGAILVKDGRIIQVGPTSDIVAPKGATVVDLRGKTVLPGFIDSHAHLDALPRDLLDANSADALIYLAFGVTTAKDPANGGEHGHAYSELIDAGVTVGPRLFGAEALVNSAEQIASFGDALGWADRTIRIGGTFLKYHTGWNAEQRRWIADAARQRGLNYAAHWPTSNYLYDRLNLTTVLNGVTSGEHELRSAKEHADSIMFLAQSGTYINFASIAYRGLYHLQFWDEAANDPRMRQFYRESLPVQKALPKGSNDAFGLPPLTDDEENVAKMAAAVVREGGHVTVGSHGDYKGIGFHWELWAYVHGGMPVHEVLRAATINGAYSLGVEKDLGSIEVGKLADILIFDKSPLQDIRNSMSLSLVMQGGVLRESETLDEIWPEKKPLPEWRMPTASSPLSE
jgi:imidazolonepropionase-like amidohydrolase/Tol biopolymer transport system component